MTAGPRYKIQVGSVGEARLITVSGEIDLASAGSLEDSLVEDSSGVVIADMTDVGFMDSTGLRRLLAARDTVEADGGRLLLVFGEGPVERILDLTRLHDRFEVFPSVDLATQAIG